MPRPLAATSQAIAEHPTRAGFVRERGARPHHHHSIQLQVRPQPMQSTFPPIPAFLVAAEG